MYEAICRGTSGPLEKGADRQRSILCVSGLAILFANRWLVKFLGLPDNVSLAILGVSLIVYAAILWIDARRPTIKITDAWIAVIMEAVWVMASYVLIFVVPFSVGGKWVVALVGELVLAFVDYAVVGHSEDPKEWAVCLAS